MYYSSSWEPLEEDDPFSACEYIVPKGEYIFITCLRIVAQTLPRMLELATSVILAGLADLRQIMTLSLKDLFFQYRIFYHKRLSGNNGSRQLRRGVNYHCSKTKKALKKGIWKSLAGWKVILWNWPTAGRSTMP